jgi:hypothetical protein
MRSGVAPIRVRSSICPTRKSATSVRLMAPNCQSLDATFENGPRKEVNAECLNDHVDALECIPDHVAIERVPGHLCRPASWMGMLAADRASARTLWLARSAAFTVSSPMPRLAPITRILAIGTLNAPQIFSITAAFEKADVRRADVRLEICTVEELYPFIENG